VRKSLPEGAAIRPEDLTSPEDAARFVKETSVDIFAPAVGNIHGMFANAPNPDLDIARIQAIKEAVRIPLVLHGGSGNTDVDFTAAIQAGASMIHISTQLRAAWRQGLEESLKNMPDEVAPYNILALSVEKVAAIVAQRLRLFAGQ
jgi:fructose-bisphosphate aldolase class II